MGFIIIIGFIAFGIYLGSLESPKKGRRRKIKWTSGNKRSKMKNGTRKQI